VFRLKDIQYREYPKDMLENSLTDMTGKINPVNKD